MAALAHSEPSYAFLSAAEIASQLSPREFISLCDKVDRQFGKEVTEVSNANTNEPKRAVRRLAVKFDVLDILKDQSNLKVIICSDHSVGPIRVIVR